MQVFNSSSRVRAKARSNGSSAREPHGLQYLLTRLRSEINGPNGGSVLAFTSANPGEGVSYVVKSIGQKLAAQTGRRTLVVDARRLRQLGVADFMNMPESCEPAKSPNLWLLPHKSNGKPHDQKLAGEPDAEWALSHLQALSATFSYTLIDCPSINASYEAAMLAPEVDGVVLVVEADRTKREQILRARQTIEMADGKLMALVLNKRRHVVPEWLYRRL